MKTQFFKVFALSSFMIPFLIFSLAFGQEPIRIGMISPLSGTYAQPGVDMSNGASFYLEKIGYTMAGRKVEIIVEDEEASPSVGLNQGPETVELNKINVLVGPLLGTNSAYAVGPYQESKKVPTLIFAAADDLTQRKRGNWSVTDEPCLPASRCILLASTPTRFWGFVKSRSLPQTMLLDGRWSEVPERPLKRRGGRSLQKIWYPINAADFSPYLTQIHKDAEAMFSMFGGKSAIVLNKQFQRVWAKIECSPSGWLQIADESILPTMGDEVRGSLQRGITAESIDTPINKELVKAYRGKYGKVPSLFSEMSYDCHPLDRASGGLMKGGCQQPRKVHEGLRSVDLKETPRGPIEDGSLRECHPEYLCSEGGTGRRRATKYRDLHLSGSIPILEV